MDGRAPVIALRRRTRETLRHERAVVLQSKGTPTQAQVIADRRANQARARQLAEQAQRRQS